MSESIRVRVRVAVVEDGRLLLVPHFDTDGGAVQWNLPGGRLEFGEPMCEGAAREVGEETGLQVEVGEVLDVSEVVLPERPWHSLTITFRGRVTGGELKAEAGHRYGEKAPRWFSAEEVARVACHPEAVVRKALGP